MSEPWFMDDGTVASLPLRHRLLALYYRLMHDRRRQRVPGGSALKRVVREVEAAMGQDPYVLIDVGRIKFCACPSDPRFSWALDELRGQGEEARFLGKALRPGDTFLDVGANYGAYALHASCLVGEFGRVIAFEPQAVLARAVAVSLAMSAKSSASVVCCALGETNGELPLYAPRFGSSGSASVYETALLGKARKKNLVRCCRLDDLVAPGSLPGTVGMKLDVEGHELPVLRGAERLLREARPWIVLELNPSTAAASSIPLVEVLSYLSDLGYDRTLELGPPHLTVPIADTELNRQRNVVVLHSTCAIPS